MIRIGTRGSALALAQSQWVARQLETQGHQVNIEVIKTKGDIVKDRFDKMEGKGFFTKEIEDALSENRIDLAVHSFKDLPTDSGNSLCIRAIPKRENPLDVLVTKPGLIDERASQLDLGSRRIGTSSMRRISCLQAACPGAIYEPIRGNLPTRISKVQSSQVDAVVLAQAGINRLKPDLGDLSLIELSPKIMVPAPAQGALAIQTRDDFSPDLAFLNHEITAACTQAERGVLAYLQGGCQLPLGVLIQKNTKGSFDMHLFLGFPDDQRAPIQIEMEDSSPEVLKNAALKQLREFTIKS